MVFQTFLRFEDFVDENDLNLKFKFGFISMPVYITYEPLMA